MVSGGSNPVIAPSFTAMKYNSPLGVRVRLGIIRAGGSSTPKLDRRRLGRAISSEIG
jgi:hypothetical protein